VVDTQHKFTANPDAAVMNGIHIFSVSWLPGGQHNVETIVKHRNGSVAKHFPQGSIITGISIREWLEIAGVSLDADNPQDATSPPYPKYRVTGLVLLVRMVYSNLRRWELPYYRPQCHVTVEALPQAWGFLGGSLSTASVNGTDVAAVTVRTGVRLQVIQSGSIGAFDIIQLILRLVEASVLFGFARFATDTIAENRCCLGGRFVARTTDQDSTDQFVTPGCFLRCKRCCWLECGVPPVGEEEGAEPAVLPGSVLLCACGRARAKPSCCALLHMARDAPPRRASRLVIPK